MRKTLGMLWTSASRPEGIGKSPIGMFRPPAKTSIFPARPSGPNCERTLTESRPGFPAGAG